MTDNFIIETRFKAVTWYFVWVVLHGICFFIVANCLTPSILFIGPFCQNSWLILIIIDWIAILGNTSFALIFTITNWRIYGNFTIRNIYSPWNHLVFIVDSMQIEAQKHIKKNNINAEICWVFILINHDFFVIYIFN